MIRTTALHSYPAGRLLTADQITEFHAARIVLLLHLCGSKGRIEGLTKLAKLDFFVRYPDFFDRAAKHLNAISNAEIGGDVESAMLRHHYGPWDPRYYQILAFLRGRELLQVSQKNRTFIFSLTESGKTLAKQLATSSSFQNICTHMRAVKDILGPKSGDALKKLVYVLFDEEVARLPLGEVIRP